MEQEVTTTAEKLAPVTFKVPAGWKLTPKLAEKLGGMNRVQRRAWCKKAENRKGR